jgi:hypothetical protein
MLPRADQTKGDYIAGTGETQCVHFIQNQRTVPLHASFDACEYREDGWCELTTFLKVQKTGLAEAEYSFTTLLSKNLSQTLARNILVTSGLSSFQVLNRIEKQYDAIEGSINYL